jgi:hypothetical protein
MRFTMAKWGEGCGYGMNVSPEIVEPIPTSIPQEPTNNSSWSPHANSNRNFLCSVQEDDNRVDDSNENPDRFEFEIGLDDIPPLDRVENMVMQDDTPIGNTSGNDGFMNMDFTPYEDPNYNSEDEDFPSMTDWPLRDRSDSHPVASFNDIDAILSIIGDGHYFDDNGYVTEDGLGVCQFYCSKDHLKWVVHHYHINMNRTFRVRHSNKSVWTIECTNQECFWRLYASKRASDNEFIINTRTGPHECLMESDRLEHPHLTSAFMASIIRENVKGNVKFKIKDIKVAIEQKYSFKANYLKCWRAKEIAIAQLFGGWRKAYDLINPLLTTIQRANPGTRVEWFTRPSNNPTTCFFKMVCWAFGPAIEAFKYLMPVIGIDGTHISGRYKGKLLVSCGYDAEDQFV